MNIQLMQIKDIPIMEQLAKEIWREYSICFISAEQIEYMLEKFQSEIAIKEQLSKAYEYYFLQENFRNWKALWNSYLYFQNEHFLY